MVVLFYPGAGTLLPLLPPFASCQVLKVEGHGQPCDLWSVGVMAYALIAGEFPWYSGSRDVCGQMIKYSELKFPEEASICPLLLYCLLRSPSSLILLLVR